MTDGDLANANVALLLERSSMRRGDAPCVVAPDGRVLWTFGGLAEAAARLAGGLVELGLGHGDRVLILERDARELYRLVVGIIWAGAVATVPPASVSLSHALGVAAAARPRAVAASLPLWTLALAQADLREAPVRLTSGRWPFPGTVSIEALGRHQPIAPRTTFPRTPALQSFTTGSTGPAAAVTRTHGVLRAQHESLAALRPLDDSDRDLVGLPLLVLDDLARGVTTVLAPRGPGSRGYGRAVREALARTGATSAAGFPHLFESALHGANRGDLDALRSIHVGGNRVQPGLLAGLKTVAPAAGVTVVYGSTQVEPISAIDGDAYLDLLATSEPADGICVGTVLDGLRVRIEPIPESPAAPVDGTVGRILVRGPRAAGPPDAGDWVDTGDVGRIAADGRLWLLGRASNVVGSLYPAPVERAVETLPWVRVSALVRVGSGHGTRAALAVQPIRWGSRGVRAEQLRRLAKLADARGWPIDEIILLKRLPTSGGAAAKIDVDRLRDLVRRRQRPSPGVRASPTRSAG